MVKIVVDKSIESEVREDAWSDLVRYTTTPQLFQDVLKVILPVIAMDLYSDRKESNCFESVNALVEWWIREGKN